MNPHLQRAHMLYQRSRYGEAERELGMALTKDPEEPWAYALLGACRAAQKDFAKADELGRQAVALAPDDGGIRHLAARIQLARNDLPAALKTATEAIELDPYNASFHATRAAVHAQRKSWKQALADCESALAIDPEHVEAINIRSLARRASGDVQSATEELQAALQVDPEDAHSHANLGWTHLQSGQLAEAEKHFREALRLDPELDWARVGVLETLKAKVPVYRWILGYFLWMQTKAAGAQWAIIIGLYIAYRVVRGIAADNPALAPFLQPLLVLYLLFAVATWFAQPLANAALLVHPFGRLALNTKEKVEGCFVATLIVVVLALWLVHYVSESRFYLLLAVIIGTCGLPWAFSFKFEHWKPRRIMQAGAGVITAIGLLLFVATFNERLDSALPSGLVMLFLASPLATMIGANVLATQQWRE